MVIFRQLTGTSPATQQMQPAQCLPLMADTDTCSAEGARNVAAENANLLWCHGRCWGLTYAIKPRHIYPFLEETLGTLLLSAELMPTGE